MQDAIWLTSRARAARLPTWIHPALALPALLFVGLQDALAAGYAAPQPVAVPGAGTGTVRVFLALVLVLAAVYGAAWAMRRLRHFSGGVGNGLQVVAQVGLGARERAVLVRAGDQHLLLGVANGSVRLLCELRPDNTMLTDAPAAGPGASAGAAAAGTPGTLPARPNFRDLLMRSLGK
jgi:flagellar protein FliO/FliZ